MKTAFKPDDLTTVVAVKSYKAGDKLVLSEAVTSTTATATGDVCMVKLNVGPGNPGPAGAPSTSPGIGIEIWLPTQAKWNGRIHALGGGGFQGGAAGSATAIGNSAGGTTAGTEGAVTSFTDTGHSYGSVLDGSSLMKPDGTINTALWTDFASRALHEQAVKTKALATAYYGKAPSFSYWEGGSTGGRQGLNLAQNNPTDYDGIIANFPAINWTRFITGELYGQIVFRQDLAATPLTVSQLNAVSNAAIGACDLVGGQHLGYILDPSSCNYDPTTDATMLCTSDGGSNTTTDCVTRSQATAMNKLWYGMTVDGSVPSPSTDNGWSEAATSALLGSGTHRWFGLTRGSNLTNLSNPAAPFLISTDQVALELQNPAISTPTFVNASGNGQNLWQGMTYAQLANAFDRGLALQSSFGNINTDNPDLSAFQKRGGKLITWHGLADELIMPQGTVNYYNRVAAQMGGLASVQAFYRLYLPPGLGHGSPNGTSNRNAVIPNWTANQQYQLLTDWVEKGIAPDTVVLSTTSGSTTVTRPICSYPKKPTYSSGSPTVAASWTCS